MVALLHRMMHAFTAKQTRKRQTCMRLCLLHKQLWWKLILLAGLELFFIKGGGGPQWGAPSAFFAFLNSVEASRAGKVMLAQPCLGEALPGGRSAAAAAGSILEVCRSCLQLRLMACSPLQTAVCADISCRQSSIHTINLRVNDRIE